MYVQQALCAPSRTVMLTGRRPDRSRVWTIGPYFRDTTGRGSPRAVESSLGAPSCVLRGDHRSSALRGVTRSNSTNPWPGPDWVTLPQAFKQQGYVTGGAGKLFHTGAPSGLLTEKDNVTGWDSHGR
jgi:arylsulfatase A-like enzyme